MKASGEISREEYWNHIRDFLIKLEEFNSWQHENGVQVKLDDKGILLETKLIHDDKSKEILRLNPLQIRSAPFTVLAEGKYEAFQLQITFEFAKHSSVFLDVGANIGVYGIVLAKRLPNLEIFAFEPLFECYKVAQENYELNQCSSGISQFRFALGDEITAKEMFTPAYTGTAGASFANQHPHEGIPKKEVVQIRTIDSLKLANLDLIKIDVEGFEYQVLNGGTDTLARDKPTVIVEILRKWSQSFDRVPQDTFHILVEMGYFCFEIRENSLRNIVEMNNSIESTNFVFCHPDRKLHWEVLEKYRK